MTYFTYTRTNDSGIEKVTSYLKRQHFTPSEQIIENSDIKTHWSERQIGASLQSAKAGDAIVAYDATELACSTSQVLEILDLASKNKISIHFVKYDTILQNDSNFVNSHQLLRLIGKIESDFISKRTAQALARRRAAGLPLGRPKGRKNKSLKLDKHKADILKYLELGIGKASIAKLVNCHPQTLYDWLSRHEISSKQAADS